MDFENKAPKWDAAGAEPSADLQENGFMAGYKPPAPYFNYLFNRIVAAIKEIQAKLSKVDNTADSEKPVSTAQANAIADAKAAAIADAKAASLPIGGGELTGGLTVMDNFNVNKTFDGVEYKTYARPINYSIGNNGDFSTGLIHYKENVNQAQLMFNKDGVMLRDNVNAKAYKLFGQHNTGDAPFLPLTGGTLSGALLELLEGYGRWQANANQILISARNKKTDTSRCIQIQNDTAYGTLSDIYQFVIYDGNEWKYYKIFGEHNKPSGSYTGNGSATQRTVAVGGIGEVLTITSDVGMALVTNRGAICLNRQTGAVSGLKSYEVNYQGGVLTIATANTFVNGNPTAYWYQVL